MPDCPRCFGAGEERVAGDGLTIPDEWPPCGLCGGLGDVSDETALLYTHGHWLLTMCDECGEERICVDDGLMLLCAACWPVVVEAKEAAQ
jgi:hypothetical protein